MANQYDFIKKVLTDLPIIDEELDELILELNKNTDFIHLFNRKYYHNEFKKNILLFCSHRIFMSLLYSAFRGIKYASSLTDKETKDRITYQIGDVTIGTDSITALRRISQRLMSIKGDVNTIVYEDSIGYYFLPIMRVIMLQ